MDSKGRVMTTRLECAGVILTGPPWTVDGEPQKDAEAAVTTFMDRIYNSTLPVPAAITQHIRRYGALQIACPEVMVRRAMERAEPKLGIPELAKKSGVSERSIRRILAGKQGPTAKKLYAIMHALL